MKQETIHPNNLNQQATDTRQNTQKPPKTHSEQNQIGFKKDP